jgi:hypothetical protein
MDRIKKEQLEELTTEFLKIIVNHFKEWANNSGESPNLETFIKFLVGSSLVPQKQILYFMTVYLYPLILQKKKGKKMQAIYELENFIPLQDTQIRTILKHYNKTFHYNKNLVENEESV